MKLVKSTHAALLCAALFTFAAEAQSTGQLLMVSRVTVKPGRVPEFMEVEKQLAEMYKKAGGSWRYAWRNRTGNGNIFTFTSPLDNYAAMDAPPAWWDKTPPAQRANLLARRRDCVENAETTYERTIPELIVGNTQGSAPKMIRVTRTRVRPGMGDQYIAAIKELSDAMKKAGMSGYRVRRLEYGGSRAQFTTNIAMDKMADLDGDSAMTKAMGGREAMGKWMAKVSPLVAYSEYHILSHVPDLSFDNRAR